MQVAIKKLDLPAFQKLSQSGSILIDTRNRFDFLKGYVKGSYSYQYKDGKFDLWLKKLVPKNTKFMLTCQNEQEEKDIMNKLIELGYDQSIQGFINYENLKSQQLVNHPTISEKDFAIQYSKNWNPEKEGVLDCRAEDEKKNGYVKGSDLVNVWEMENILKEKNHKLNLQKTYYVYCKSGLRAVLAMSIMNKYGFNNLVHIGGMDELSQLQDLLPIEFQKE